MSKLPHGTDAKAAHREKMAFKKGQRPGPMEPKPYTPNRTRHGEKLDKNGISPKKVRA